MVATDMLVHWSVSNWSIKVASRRLFQNLSFQVHEGEIIELKGPNGSGKSCFIKSLVGLKRRHAGVLRYKQDDLGKEGLLPLVKTKYFGHETAARQRLTVRENVLLWLGSCQHGDLIIPMKALLNQVDELLHTNNLTALAHQEFRRLSAGQKKQVCLLRLLMGQVDIWLLDEPFTSLDQASVEVWSQKLLQLVKDGGSILLVNHQPSELANRSIYLPSKKAV